MPTWTTGKGQRDAIPKVPMTYRLTLAKNKKGERKGLRKSVGAMPREGNSENNACQMCMKT